MEQAELERIIEAILFAAGEPVETQRLAMAAECDADEIDRAAQSLMDRLSFDRRGLPALFLRRDVRLYYQGA